MCKDPLYLVKCYVNLNIEKKNNIQIPINTSLRSNKSQLLVL